VLAAVQGASEVRPESEVRLDWQADEAVIIPVDQ